MNEHQKNRQFIAKTLQTKWRDGGNAEWCGMSIIHIKGTNHVGIFIADLDTFDGEQAFVIMSRELNAEEGTYTDTEIRKFESDCENIEEFLAYLEWL